MRLSIISGQTGFTPLRIWNTVSANTVLPQRASFERSVRPAFSSRSGVNIKAAQYIMGHAKSDVTLDVYNHLNNAFDAKLEIKKLEKNGTVMVQ